MKKIDHCPCCKSKNLKTVPATIESFILARMTGDDKSYSGRIPCLYLYCLDCDFLGTEYRFEKEEENNFYKNYMEDEYINHRCRYDGEGVRSFLKSLHTTRDIQPRIDACSDILLKVIDPNSVKSLLDFGGHTGKLIPPIFNHAKKYVTDVEIRSLPDGVLGITSFQDCEPVDLLICLHTLEHVSDPRHLIEEMKKYIKSGSWLYLEVPNEDLSHIPGHNFHEHLNRFTAKCLKNILTSVGFKNLNSNEIKYPHPWGNAIAITGILE
jgi:SAM-dependent methyltransferase